MRAEVMYRRKMCDVAEQMADHGYQHIDDFELRKHVPSSEIEELAGFYIDSTSVYERKDFLLDGIDCSDAEDALTRFLKTWKTDEKNRVAVELLERIGSAVVVTALGPIIDDINRELQFILDSREHIEHGLLNHQTMYL